ncbi:MAG: ribonuclease R [Pseudomonadales bacterium]|nr:ribonuclease R [Pseudomonadales bacterium]
MPSRKKSQKNPTGSRDPFASREAARYANPIASREHILAQLEKIGEPVYLDELAENLQLETEEQVEALRRRLIAMSRDGQIISNRRGAYGLTAHMDLVKGMVQGTKDGAGYFIPDNNESDMFLSLREMARLFDGDKVLARFTGIDARGRREASVVEILERRHEEVVGRFYLEDGFGLLVPDNKRIQHEILIAPSKSGSAEDGQYVLARILEYPSKRRKAIAEVVEVLGDVATPGIEIDIALHSFAIPSQWPSAVKKEAARLPKHVSETDLAGRHDLRDVPFVTIDGDDAKDFDDAVFATANRDRSWTLYVAIADVSHYVGVASALNEEAQNRGTSVYFPGHVVPMLPEKISNGLCSLKPNCDRLAMVCELTISAEGETIAYKFYEAVIHSHARLTYTEVADMLQPPTTASQEKIKSKLRKRYKAVIEGVDELYALYKSLHEARVNRGAMDFDSTETRMVFGEDRKIREIVPVERNDAHRLIEECMLSANVAAAELLQHCECPALYRVHAGPNPDKLDGLREFLAEMGLHLGGGEQPKPSDYQKTIKQIGDRPDRHMLQTMLIKSMMQAVYQPENSGHFGLGFSAYTHFTSPIRRFPDLLVHRAIRYLIRNKKDRRLKRHPDQSALARNTIYPYSVPELISLGESCSAQERRADAASYSVMDWLKCEYMQDRVGDEYEGTITSVTSFGLFVELGGIYIEGLVHITELSNDYYHFDPIRHSLEGERSRQVYRLGDLVSVRVARVDLEEKKIDLQMLNSDSTKSRSRRKVSDKTARRGKNKAAKRSKSRKSASAKNNIREKLRGKKAGKEASKKARKQTANKKRNAKSKSGKKPRSVPKRPRR